MPAFKVSVSQYPSVNEGTEEWAVMIGGMPSYRFKPRGGEGAREAAYAHATELAADLERQGRTVQRFKWDGFSAIETPVGAAWETLAGEEN